MRYVLRPGYVQSQNDGDTHYVSAAALPRLHEVRLSDCIVHSFERPARGLTGDEIWLYPRYDGQYHDYSKDPGAIT